MKVYGMDINVTKLICNVFLSIGLLLLHFYFFLLLKISSSQKEKNIYSGECKSDNIAEPLHLSIKVQAEMERKKSRWCSDKDIPVRCSVAIYSVYTYCSKHIEISFSFSV